MDTRFLVSAKTDYLLSASLDSLHQEAQEWMSEIAFWHDELAFFYRLLQKKEAVNVFPSRDLAAIQRSLIAISSEKLGKIREAVRRHEQSLIQVITTVSASDEDQYRESHRRLLLDMHELHAAIRAFKRELFVYLK